MVHIYIWPVAAYLAAGHLSRLPDGIGVFFSAREPAPGRALHVGRSPRDLLSGLK